ncbi:MAG: DUF1080 domain-containing protein [Planctomycetaceae bacterium]|nr:DUF1080 domain-containing protein [Planctomycetaceae bacterium]
MRLLIALVFALSCAPPSAQEELFNGKDLTGFYTYLQRSGKNNDPDHVFTVHDGMIHVSGKEFGYIATEKEYENFHLKAEFKWGEATWPPREKAARDSGILFHMQGEDKVWPRSIEFQIIEGGTGDLLVVGGASIAFDPSLEKRLAEPKSKMLSPDGTRIIRSRVDWEKRSKQWKDVLGMRGEDDLERPRGEWNTLQLECRGDHLIYWVNGTKVLEARGAEPRKGRILFQSEGAELFFRKLELKTL